jgi:hypothetical protein
VRSPKIKVHAVFLVLLVAGCLPSLASAQEQPFLLRGNDWRPKREGRADKVDLLYKASRTYLWVGTSLDMATTVRALQHPGVARREDRSFLMNYPIRETGWAGRLGIRNAGGVVAANVALNFGIDLLGQKLYRKGGRWRFLAIGLNLFKGTDNAMAGIHNLGYCGGGLDQRIRQATGYRGQIVWTRH